MSEENFLERWSRRKRGQTNEEDNKQEIAALPPETADAGPAQQEKQEETAKQSPDATKAEDKAPVVDLSKLPSIDSITATTDIRMFMLPGVPMALRQAALRKVWVTDPKIRDFIGIAENQWDFTVDSPGFDFSPPTGDIKKMVAEIFGQSQEEKEAEARQATPSSPVPSGKEAESKEGGIPNPVRLPGAETAPENRNAIPEKALADPDTRMAAKEKSENDAAQNIGATQDRLTHEIPRRRHGSALPG